MKPEVELSERTLNRIRDYVARESLAGRQTTVQAVLEESLRTIADVRERKVRR